VYDLRLYTLLLLKTFVENAGQKIASELLMRKQWVAFELDLPFVRLLLM